MNNTTTTATTYSTANHDVAAIIEGFGTTYDYPTFERFQDLAIALDCVPDMTEEDFWGVPGVQNIRHPDGRVGMIKGGRVAIEEAFEDEALVSALLASIAG